MYANLWCRKDLTNSISVRCSIAFPNILKENFFIAKSFGDPVQQFLLWTINNSDH